MCVLKFSSTIADNYRNSFAFANQPYEVCLTNDSRESNGSIL